MVYDSVMAVGMFKALNESSIAHLPPELIQSIGTFLTEHGQPRKDLISFCLSCHHIKAILDDIIEIKEILECIHEDFKPAISILNKFGPDAILRHFKHLRRVQNHYSLLMHTKSQSKHTLFRGQFHHPNLEYIDFSDPFLAFTVRVIHFKSVVQQQYIAVVVFTFNGEHAVSTTLDRDDYLPPIPITSASRLFRGEAVRVDRVELSLVNKPWLARAIKHAMFANKGTSCFLMCWYNYVYGHRHKQLDSFDALTQFCSFLAIVVLLVVVLNSLALKHLQ